MTNEEWRVWLVEQSASLSGPSTPFIQGQRAVYDETTQELGRHHLMPRKRLAITLEWLMAHISLERQHVIVAQDDPPERSNRPYHEGRLSAYQHMHMRFQLAQMSGDESRLGDADRDTNTAFFASTQPNS